MFENLGWAEITVLLLIALFVIGPERLPKVLGEIGKGIRKIRRMASDATADISKEVGTDINITDLHPKTFIRKHILSEEDEEALKNPLKSALSDIKQHTQPLQEELNETASAIRSKPKAHNDSPSSEEEDASPAPAATRQYDTDAT